MCILMNKPIIMEIFEHCMWSNLAQDTCTRLILSSSRYQTSKQCFQEDIFIIKEFRGKILIFEGMYPATNFNSNSYNNLRKLVEYDSYIVTI